MLGETLFAWDRRIVGEYYPYKCRGEHDHDHSFLSVLARAILKKGEVWPEQRSRYYTHWMIRQLNVVRIVPQLWEEARAWAENPEGTAEELAALWPYDFSLGDHAHLYSREQQAALEGIISYQKAALAGTAP